MSLNLKPGDVLSYSSGSHDRGPYGFRTLREGTGAMALLARRWPHALAGMAGRVPLVINAYPAVLGRWDFGVVVDSYLSLSTGSRALHLAALEQMPVMLLGQPLYVADLLYRHIKRTPKLSDFMVIGTGGYPMPATLQKTLEDLCAGVGCKLSIVHGYGVAEVDSSCLLAVDRNDDGTLTYYPRPDVVVELDAKGEILLSLHDGKGSWVVQRFATGDFATPSGEGFLIGNPERFHPHVQKILESWSPRDWERRTGYVYFGRELRFQLRKGFEPEGQVEADFIEFTKRYGHSWLFKPLWGRQKDAGLKDPLRRTILLMLVRTCTGTSRPRFASA